MAGLGGGGVWAGSLGLGAWVVMSSRMRVLWGCQTQGRCDASGQGVDAPGATLSHTAGCTCRRQAPPMRPAGCARPSSTWRGWAPAMWWRARLRARASAVAAAVAATAPACHSLASGPPTGPLLCMQHRIQSSLAPGAQQAASGHRDARAGGQRLAQRDRGQQACQAAAHDSHVHRLLHHARGCHGVAADGGGHAPGASQIDVLDVGQLKATPLSITCALAREA